LRSGGESRGGELALLLGSNFREINAVAAWVPSGVVFWALGLAEPGDTRPRAAWTFRGKPLPFLQEDNAAADAAPVAQPGRPIAYAPIYLSHLENKQAVERATIPVENIKGPVQLVSGTDDQQWPSSALADIAAQRLEAHRHRYPFQHLKYQGAGHRILLPYGPRTVRVIGFQVQGFEDRLYSQGGTPKADAEAGVDAWRKLLEFLRDGVEARG
jgi:dienelactone hydrolase